MQSNDFNTLRKKIRVLENEIDSKLVVISQRLNSQKNISKVDQKEMESLFSQCSQVHSEMIPSNPTNQHMLNRHKEILMDYKLEYEKMKEIVMQHKEKEELLMADTIDDEIDEVDHLQSIRDNTTRIDRTNRMVNDMINQSEMTQQDLLEQSRRFMDTQQKLKGLHSRFPIINNLIGRISAKKKRDLIILSLIISILVIISYYIVF